VTTYTDHGKTSSSERSCDQTPNLSERDRRTFKRVVSKKDDKTAAAEVRAELNMKSLFAYKQSHQCFTNPTTIKGEKDGVMMMIKPGRLMIANM